jgi:hypothetical protein
MNHQNKEAIRKLQKLGQRLDLVWQQQRPAKDNSFEPIKAIVQKKWADGHYARKLEIKPPVVSDSELVRVVVGEPLPPKERSSIKPSSGAGIKAIFRDKQGRIVSSNHLNPTEIRSSEGAKAHRRRPKRPKFARKKSAKHEGAGPK